MKIQLLILSFLGCGFAFGQNFTNGPITPGLSGAETFRFGPGFASQIQAGTGFGTGSGNRWFSFGEVSTLSQTLYGNRFQYNERALVTGYTSLSPNNPRIEWIHNGGTTAGNLQFKVASSFTSLVSTLVAEMTPQGNTYFGKYTPGLFNALSAKTAIGFEKDCGLDIVSVGQLPSNIDPIAANIQVNFSGNSGIGLLSNVFNGSFATGVFGKASGLEYSYGVFGRSTSSGNFSAAIYGDLPVNVTGNYWAGYFDGEVYSTGGYLPSDSKLKNSINKEASALEKLILLNPVSYNYSKVEGMNLPQTLQHGFISQELADVFPELTKDVVKPVFDENGKITSEVSFKAINYVGLISVLTAAVQELNSELIKVRSDLDEYKANDVVRGQIIQSTPIVNGYSIEQNVPNPFSDRTSIRFQLAPGVESATLSIFNLNGAFVRDYSLKGNSGEIEILASEIGKGMYIYSLNQNGQEIISKRMIIQ
ncbi:T9SS type A sorting domain-containing protein [Flavobacterium sp.]|uniref:T9SS type A sorting domain-containing protein n=1 Tax=Flavobacterium sp. TaxID=239 RepID=UPI0025DEE021|nr:T9SS type A sorting domain-containing protein [Flavobacterium sp.]